MDRITATLATAIFTSFVAWTSVVSPRAQNKSAKDGAYTAAQAERGNAEYGKNCASCHKDDMSGSTEAPALVGEKFIGAWRDRTVGDLYDLVRTTMPYDQPNSLAPQAYADIVASMLQKNNYQVGSEELSTDPEALKNLLLK
jgi:mono/diheme cytochrome c family protein